MISIDEMAYRSPLRAWSPTGKLLAVLALLMGSLLSPTPAVPLLVAVAGLVLLWKSCRLRLPDVMAFACMETLMMMAFAVAVLAVSTPGQLLAQTTVAGLHLQVTREGANLAALVLARTVAGFLVLLFFASSTPLPHLFYAMRQIGLPDFLAELTVLVYRYSFMLMEQVAQMWTAAECRMGFGGLRKTLRTTGRLAAGLFGRSMDFAQRAESALLCRNFRGEFTPYRLPAPLTAGWVGASVLVLAVLVLLGQQFPHLLVI